MYIMYKNGKFLHFSSAEYTKKNDLCTKVFVYCIK